MFLKLLLPHSPRSDWQVGVSRPYPIGFLCSTWLPRPSQLILCSSFGRCAFPSFFRDPPGILSATELFALTLQRCLWCGSSPVCHLPESRPLALPPEQLCRPPHGFPARSYSCSNPFTTLRMGLSFEECEPDYVISCSNLN